MSDQNITLSVKLTAQNSNPRLLNVLSYTLTQGSWDGAGEPGIGQPIAPATTGCWLCINSSFPASIQGSMTFQVAQAGTLEVTWNLNQQDPFNPQLINNVVNDPELGASLVVNQGDFAHVWVQLILSVVATVLPGETLSDIADRYDTDVATLKTLNGIQSNTQLTPGQHILVASPAPGGGPLDCGDS